MAEHSFDIGSKVDRQELSNAVDMAKKEVNGRFDFKGSKTEIKIEKDCLQLAATSEMQLRQLIEILQSRLAKRDLSLKAFKFGEFETNVTGIQKCRVAIQNGLAQDQVKKINKLIKESKIKVQSRAQGDSIRVVSKKLDELQAIQKMILDAGLDFDASFDNYK